MSAQSNEKLQALTERILFIRESQDLVSLLDSMGFFAILNALHTLQETKTQLFDTATSYAGGIIQELNDTLKNYSPRQHITTKIRSLFRPSNK